MATIYDIAGTTSHTFTLGDGTTIFYGIATPSDDMGKIGDIYVQMKKELYGVNIVKYATSADDPGTTDPTIEINNFQDYASHYQRCYDQPLPVGTYVKYVGETSGAYTKGYYYRWNGTSWESKFNGNESLGRVWYKEAFNNTTGSRWSYIKTYTFDNAVINAYETGDFTNDFRVKIESADNIIPGGSIDESTTAETDYTVNHRAYGVTRFATDNESRSHVDKFISETPKQTYDNIIAITGLLSDLETPDTTNLVASDNSLQRQIDTIVSKSDVVDIVGTYAELEAYDTSDLGDDDVIKILQDETNSKATTYYRYLPVPEVPPAISVPTDSDLPAVTSTDDGKVAIVAADSTHSGYYECKYINDEYAWAFIGETYSGTPDYTVANKSTLPTATSSDVGKVAEVTANETFYECRKVNGTYAWAYSGPTIDDLHHDDHLHYWKRIGEEGPFYTKSEADGRFVHLEGSDTITGTKDFTGATVTVATQVASDNSNKAASTQYVTTAISTEDELVVHRSGQDTITGTKDFTGATVTVATQATSDDSNKAASTEFVHDLVDTSLLPAYDSTTAGKYLSVDNNGDTVWASINNVPLGDLSDVYLSSESDGQVLIYDPTLNSNAGGWKNGSQVTATIKYW